MSRGLTCAACNVDTLKDKLHGIMNIKLIVGQSHYDTGLLSIGFSSPCTKSTSRLSILQGHVDTQRRHNPSHGS